MISNKAKKCPTITMSGDPKTTQNSSIWLNFYVEKSSTIKVFTTTYQNLTLSRVTSKLTEEHGPQLTQKGWARLFNVIMLGTHLIMKTNQFYSLFKPMTSAVSILFLTHTDNMRFDVQQNLVIKLVK